MRGSRATWGKFIAMLFANILRRVAAASLPRQTKIGILPNVADLGSVSRNFIIETQNYFIEGFIFNGSGSIFITFEHAGGPMERPRKYREGWGSGFLRSLEIDHVSVKPKIKDWYTKGDLPAALKKLRPLLSSYREVVTYGCSMGGFAALTFADLIGATTVMAISPQSTLDPRKTPWDTRFPASLKCDFTGSFGDAVGKSLKAKRVLVAVDRYFAIDMRHLTRINAENVTVLHMPFMGHTIAVNMQRLGLLSYMVKSVSNGSFNKTEFQALARRRKMLPSYIEALHNRVIDKPIYAAITARYLEALSIGQDPEPPPRAGENCHQRNSTST